MPRREVKILKEPVKLHISDMAGEFLVQLQHLPTSANTAETIGDKTAVCI